METTELYALYLAAFAAARTSQPPPAPTGLHAQLAVALGIEDGTPPATERAEVDEIAQFAERILEHLDETSPAARAAEGDTIEVSLTPGQVRHVADALEALHGERDELRVALLAQLEAGA